MKQISTSSRQVGNISRHLDTERITGYFFLMLVVRLLTQRPGAQMTMFEFVIVFLVGGVVILATVGADKSITNCVMAILTVGLLHNMVAWTKARSPR